MFSGRLFRLKSPWAGQIAAIFLAKNHPYQPTHYLPDQVRIPYIQPNAARFNQAKIDGVAIYLP